MECKKKKKKKKSYKVDVYLMFSKMSIFYLACHINNFVHILGLSSTRYISNEYIYTHYYIHYMSWSKTS